MALQEYLRCDGLDRTIHIAKSEYRQHQPQDSVTIAAHPIQIALRPSLPHEEHDAGTPVQWGNREQVKGAEQEIEREESAQKVLSKVRPGAAMQPTLGPSDSQANGG